MDSTEPPDGTAPARAPRGVFHRVSAIGTAAQASVPGLYAWAATVAPAAFGRGSSAYARLAAVVALVPLAVGIVMERRWGPSARYLSVWGLVAMSAIVWVLVPTALTPARMDVVRGLSGMVGWALFAFACAAPALGREASAKARVAPEAPMRPRTQIQHGDAAYIGGGIVLALALQGVGWQVAVPERALLIRLIALAAGIGLIGTATSISLARHQRVPPAVLRLRIRRALPWMVAMAMLALAGVMLSRA